MKAYVSMFALTVAMIVATTTQTRAQVIFAPGPIWLVAWTTVPVNCTTAQGAGLKAPTATGGITFRPAAHGTIVLNCYVTSIMRVDPTFVNAFGLTFLSNGSIGGVDQCLVSATVEAQPYGGKFPTLIGFFSTAGQNFTTPVTANVPLTTFLDVDANLYMVTIALVRQTGATCNPVVDAAVLQEEIF